MSWPTDHTRMGVIQRQGLKYTVLNFIGLAIGTASTLLVYSRAEVVETYGLAQYLLSLCVLSFPLLSLSAHTVGVRFFPHFQDLPRGREVFFGLVVLMPLTGWLLWAIPAALWWPWLQQRAGLSGLQMGLVFPLTLFYSLSLTLTYYASNRQRIVVPSLLFEVSLKLTLPLLMLALWQSWLEQWAVLALLVGHFALVAAALFFYLIKLGERIAWPRWAEWPASLRRDMLGYGVFGITSGLALLLATKADTFLVGSLTDMRRTGIYAIALNIAVAMDIPLKGLLTVSIPIMSQHLAQDNRPALRALYESVSVHLLAAGLFLFGCIVVAADDLYRIMPNSAEVSEGKQVLLLLCAAKLVETAMSLNGPMVYYSQYYRYSLASLAVLALANVAFSLWLIPLLGINGAALAALLTAVAYQAIGAILVWLKFGLQPFSRKTLWLALFAAAAIAFAWVLPDAGHPLANIVARGGVFSIVFGGAVLWSGVSPEMVQTVQHFIEKISAVLRGQPAVDKGAQNGGDDASSSS
ncbi:MAG: polysaccharide biosynthesis C-terminal domain-containing protein [Saprospiraceae bacterium]|nr:polysaccharide biosynthesis C-terminal domain-containing protein [Saprospiraceae bacterium]MDW8228477.1 polysaccharide biosynthesis C-terminal domain-containing protein [Saprospiraceae bacterium]